jgi:3-isopropylmalate/(R)-2-methylmalate dehydratase small subunit
VIAPSYSDIFASNSFKNGILAVELPREAVDRLMEVAKTDPITIDLENQVVTTPFQDRFEFPLDPFRKHCLMAGLDEIGLTMESEAAIAAYENKIAAERPWLAP